jgi:hypothetical protein
MFSWLLSEARGGVTEHHHAIINRKLPFDAKKQEEKKNTRTDMMPEMNDTPSHIINNRAGSQTSISCFKCVSQYLLDTSVYPREATVLKELRERTEKHSWYDLFF